MRPKTILQRMSQTQFLTVRWRKKAFGDHFFCSRQSTFSFSLCLPTYSCLGRVTDGSEDGGTSYFLFYWLSISSIPSCRAATKSYTHHASSLSHTHCDVCICVWLWLIFIFCGCFRRLVSLCCRVQFAIRQQVWNGELRSKMWCVWFLKGDGICNLHGDTAMEIWKIPLPLSSSSITTIYIKLLAVRCFTKTFQTRSCCITAAICSQWSSIDR